MRGLCFPAQQGEFWDLARKHKGPKFWKHSYPRAREALQCCNCSLLGDPFGLCLFHLWGAWTEAGLSALCLVGTGMSYCYQAGSSPPHTTICFCLLQVCFFSCLPFLPVSLFCWVIFSLSSLNRLCNCMLSKTQEGLLIKDRYILA